MEGINVLNSYELSQYIYHTNWVILIIGLIITLGLSFFFFFIFNKGTHKTMVGVSIIIACFITILGSLVSGTISRSSEKVTTICYEVILEGDSYYDDLISKYDIVGQRGQIYVVKEKGE